jgi:hypothetical protein
MFDTAVSNTNKQHAREVKPPVKTSQRALVLLNKTPEKAETKLIAAIYGINDWKYSDPVMLNVNPIATNIPDIPAIIALVNFNFIFP